MLLLQVNRRTSCKISKSIHLLPRRLFKGGPHGLLRGSISIGDIQAFFLYVGQIIGSTLSIVPTL